MTTRDTTETLPDLVADDLRALSIGLNPSLPSIRAGFYFANPRNRFWAALAGAGFLAPGVVPGPAAQAHLFAVERIGFTDVAKRPTAGGSALRAADFRDACPALLGRLERHRPAVAWFHGKMAYRAFVRHAGLGIEVGPFGLQVQTVAGCAVYVTPNPSPANAAFSLEVLVGWYRDFAAILPPR